MNELESESESESLTITTFELNAIREKIESMPKFNQIEVARILSLSLIHISEPTRPY